MPSRLRWTSTAHSNALWHVELEKEHASWAALSRTRPDHVSEVEPPTDQPSTMHPPDRELWLRLRWQRMLMLMWVGCVTQDPCTWRHLAVFPDNWDMLRYCLILIRMTWMPDNRIPIRIGIRIRILGRQTDRLAILVDGFELPLLLARQVEPAVIEPQGPLRRLHSLSDHKLGQTVGGPPIHVVVSQAIGALEGDLDVRHPPDADAQPVGDATQPPIKASRTVEADGQAREESEDCVSGTITDTEKVEPVGARD